ncbi:MAG: hypothetical protein VYE77_01495 [Planctomycetota bacterium]|nr:hypothetical protein [Planctomycetota bacterium]
MNSVLETILPRQANNDYRGGQVPLWGFCLLFATEIFSATVHLLTPDSGKEMIAGMIRFEGTPDPNVVVYAFGALSGANEMLLVIIFAVILWRYRNLIPFLLFILFTEQVLRLLVSTLHPIGPEYFEHTPPARLAMMPLMVFSALMLLLAVRNSSKS